MQLLVVKFVCAHLHFIFQWNGMIKESYCFSLFRLLLYEDNHPLGQVPVHMDAIINSVLWFLEHTV